MSETGELVKSMDSINVYGGVHLQGRVKIQGSKNAVLPILAATLLTKGENIIDNCPRISDVFYMQQLLRSMGCTINICLDRMTINTSNVCRHSLPAEAVKGMRSSLCMLGVLLGRNGEICMEYPGGCVIGARPIDLHLQALTAMGACFEEAGGMIRGTVNKRFHGAHICFPKVSVGATENVVLAAVLAEGETIIEGAAKEPEVVALCDYLSRCGAQITGAGTEKICVCGVQELHAVRYRVPNDRIVAGTYLLATLSAGGNVWLEDAPCEQMLAALNMARRMGAVCQTFEEGLYVQFCGELKQIEYLKTDIYPGFPTDLQSIALATLAKARGECLIEESIFENRFHVVEPLKKMGADIEILDAKHLLVKGPKVLRGCPVEAKELRGGAALLVAALAAEGTTTVTGCQYIMRGYENICRDLRELGARISSV